MTRQLTFLKQHQTKTVNKAPNNTCAKKQKIIIPRFSVLRNPKNNNKLHDILTLRP